MNSEGTPVTHTHVSISKPLPARLPHSTEQSRCLLAIQVKYRRLCVRIARLPARLCVCGSHTYQLAFPPSFPLATINSFCAFLLSQSAYVLVLSSFRDTHAWLTRLLTGSGRCIAQHGSVGGPQQPSHAFLGGSEDEVFSFNCSFHTGMT